MHTSLHTNSHRAAALIADDDDGDNDDYCKIPFYTVIVYKLL